MKKLILVVVSLFFILSNLKAAGTAGGEILSFPVGARAIGLGEAYLAIAEDPDTLHWNPGGLANLKEDSLSLFYLDGPVDVNFTSLSSAFLTNFGTLAIAFTTLQSGKIFYYPETGGVEELSGQNDYCLNFAYGRKFLRENLFLGTNLKFLFSNLPDKSGEKTAFAFAGDLGVLFKLRKINLGFALRNLGTSLTYQEAGNPLPLETHLGASFPLPFFPLRLATALGIVRGGSFHYNFGAEFVFRMLALRSGWKGGYTDQGLCLGLGINFGKFSFDYAYAPIADLESNHRISLIARF